MLATPITPPHASIFLLDYSKPQALVAEAERTFAENRARFNRFFDSAERT